MTTRIGWKHISLATKLAMVMVILFLSWNLLSPILFPPSIVPEYEGNRPSDWVKRAGEMSATTPFADFTKGNWVFGDAEWDFRIVTLKNRKELLKIPSTVREATADFDDGQMIESYKELGAKRENLGDDWAAWVPPETGMMSQIMITRNNVVQLMRSQVPGKGQLTVIEGTPRRQLTGDSLLMQLPAGVVQTSYRINESQHVTAAVLQVDKLDQNELVEFWTRHGWECLKAPTNNTGDVMSSEKEVTEVTRFHCFQADDFIECTFFLNSGGLSAILVKVPKLESEK